MPSPLAAERKHRRRIMCQHRRPPRLTVVSDVPRWPGSRRLRRDDNNRTIWHHLHMGPVMGMLESFSRAVDALNRVIGRATMCLILGSIVVSAANAVMRKFFGLGSNFWLEWQWHLYGAAFLCAGGYVLLVDEHVRVDMLSQRFGPRLRAWIDFTVLLVVALPASVLMVGMGGWLAMGAWRIGETSWHPGGPLRWPVLMCIPLGFGLLGLQALSEMIKRASFLLGRRGKASLCEADLPKIFVDPATSRASL
jgi:TRAP-type mannitol/chloroaromatic compound transport system permease small subunit